MRETYSVDVAVYNLILKSHASKGRFDKAEKTLEEMKKFEVEPNDVTCDRGRPRTLFWL